MANTGLGFEVEVRDYIETSLKAGEWGFDPKIFKVRHKAAYWSVMRESTIITDVSVEFYRPNESVYWFLWVIECKDLGGLVPVDDVEEFSKKLEQVRAHKGLMVSRRGFASGCKTFAKNSGIGLIRLTPAGPQLVLNEEFHDAPTALDFVEGFPEFRMPGRFAGYGSDGKATLSVQEFLANELSSISARHSGAKEGS
jgi:hypothetical protein